MKIHKVIGELVDLERRYGAGIEVYVTVPFLKALVEGGVRGDTVYEFSDISISIESLESGMIYCSIGKKGRD